MINFNFESFLITAVIFVVFTGKWIFNMYLSDAATSNIDI